MPKPAFLGDRPAFLRRVPFSDPGFSPSPGLLKDFAEILAGGTLSKGEHLARFELQCAEYLGVRHAIAVSSCVSGLILCLQALELSGEVVVPSFTFPAAALAIVQGGLIPVFADCDPDTFNISPRGIKRMISRKTAAIMAVYNYGAPPDMEGLEKISREHGLKLIFDSAQAWGAEYQGKRAGGFGVAEVFSFSQSKVLTTCEGGLVATNDDLLAGKVRQGRNYGKNDVGDFLFPGLSARLSEVHARIGLEQLKSVTKFLKRRRALAEIYRDRLRSLPGVQFQKAGQEARSSENYFPVMIDPKRFGLTRDGLCEALLHENIEVRKFFSPASHRHPAFTRFSDAPLPVTEMLSERCLALPIYPRLSMKKAEKISRVMGEVYRQRGR